MCIDKRLQPPTRALFSSETYAPGKRNMERLTSYRTHTKILFRPSQFATLPVDGTE
ncbi:hypothetical protein BJY01DRAFT_221424 [Aspergillus pseudoustus]|uniref:Uncharacterized protein n=1 Tax=Aspergillus pseudoustus TaxID=1810923 RepID=A0ABR4JD54_9EURO